MISKIIMPDLGATGGDVVLRQWLVQPGQRVEAGQALFMVETDKATVEVESFRGGVVRALLVKEDTAVPLGTVVAILADSLEEALPTEKAAEAGQPESLPAAAVSTSTTAVESLTGERILITPLARRIAQEEGLDLGSLSGSGRSGQILKRDIERALAKRRPADAAVPGARRQGPSAMRQAIARRTQESKTQAPHFYANISVDMGQAKACLAEAAGWAEDKGWSAPTLTDICLRATALTLRDFPSLNAAYRDEEILYFEAINIGLVVGLEEGMVIPVIHDADGHNLYSLAAITGRLKERAVKGILRGSELSGGTFSLTNLGMYGLDSFTAVINPPQAGILALGALREVPLVQDGAVVPGQQMTAVLSVDHRLVDGIVAARFMAAWKEMLEHPYRLALEPPEELNL